MSSDELIVDERGAYEVWRLNRPARRNALSFSLLALLDEARQRAAERGCSTVVLTGAEGAGAFCAGSDLGELQQLGGQEGLSGELPRSPLHELLARFEPLPFTLITAINGAAIGGGCELALLGDIRVASPGATFLLPPAKIGIVYPPEGAARLRAALGSSLLRAMFCTAKGVPAERLFQAGVLWELADDPCAAAERIAAQVASLPHAARLANSALASRIG
jgi:enoyl-CoA hydratase